jgi:ribosomal protein S18 acetylase RimI-like enzyme
MMDIEISLAKPVHAPQIYNLFKTTWLDTYPNEDYGITEKDILSRYTEEHEVQALQKWPIVYKKMNEDPSDADMLVWVALAGKQVLGLVSIDKKVPLQLGAIYVLPSHQNAGIGSKLMDFILSKYGERELAVHVASYNSRAINFYKKYGFKTEGPIKDKAGELPSGAIIPEIRMIRI